MSTSREAITRERIQTIIQGVDGLNAERVVIGLKEIEITDEFFESLADDGIYVLIEPAEQTGFSFSTRLSEFDVEVLIYFGFPADEDYTFTAIEDAVYAGIRASIIEEENWTDAPFPHGIKTSKPELAFVKPIAGLYKMTLSFYAE